MSSDQTVRSGNGGNAPHAVSDTSDNLDALISDSKLTMSGMYSNTMHPNAAFPPREMLLTRSRGLLFEGGLAEGSPADCQHHRTTIKCIDCSSSAICKHGRWRSICVLCKVASRSESTTVTIADNNDGRMETSGTSTCVHGRYRSGCKECESTSICEHGKRRRECKECGGAAICEHGRIRSRCKECGGASICEHGRHRSHFKECGGFYL